MLMARLPPSPPPRWPHLSLAGFLCRLFLHLEPASQLFIHFGRGQLLRLSGGRLSPSPRVDAWLSCLATWTTHPNASHHQRSRRRCRRLFRRQNSSGGRLPHIHLRVCLLDIFFHWPLYEPPLFLCLRLIPAWNRPGLFVYRECIGQALPRDNLLRVPVAAEPSTIWAPPVRFAIQIQHELGGGRTGNHCYQAGLRPGIHLRARKELVSYRS